MEGYRRLMENLVKHSASLTDQPIGRKAIRVNGPILKTKSNVQKIWMGGMKEDRFSKDKHGKIKFSFVERKFIKGKIGRI